MPLPKTPPRSRPFAPLSVIAGALGITTCDEGGHRSPTEAGPAPISSVSTSATPNTLVGAGNIGRCDRTGDEATTYPAPGNHEYDSSPTAAPYFSCYGAAAGEVGKGYYSYDLGAWHILVLKWRVRRRRTRGAARATEGALPERRSGGAP